MRINPFQNPGIHVKTGYFPIYFSFHKAQNLLAICGQDRVDFWNANAKPIYSFHCVETPGQISFSPSGKYLAILHGEYVSVLNTNEFRLEKKINGRKAISISFFKEDAIFLGTEFGEIFEINLEGNILSEKKFEELPILNLTYSTRHSILFARTNGNSVQLWNLNSTEKAPYLLENHSEVLSIFYSNKTSTIFCGTESGEIHIWKLKAENEPPFKWENTLKVSDHGINTIYYCGENSEIAIGTKEKELSILDAEGNITHSKKIRDLPIGIIYPHTGHLLYILRDGNFYINIDKHPGYTNLFEPAKSTYIADTFSRGEDRLNQSTDLKAFAKLIASSHLKPPLSIGIFANWGAGKSFFMRKLKEEIDSLSSWAREDMKYTSQKEIPYYKNIIQIDFNAWNYVESDLWASLVDEIFSNLKLKGERKDEAYDRRNSLISILEEEKKGLTDLRSKKKELETKKDYYRGFISFKILNKFITSKTDFPEFSTIFSELENTLKEKMNGMGNLPIMELLNNAILICEEIQSKIPLDAPINDIIVELKILDDSSPQKVFQLLAKLKNSLAFSLLRKEIPIQWKSAIYKREINNLDKLLSIILLEIPSHKLQSSGIEEILQEAKKILSNQSMNPVEKFNISSGILKKISYSSIKRNFPIWSEYYEKLLILNPKTTSSEYYKNFFDLEDILMEEEIILPEELKNKFISLSIQIEEEENQIEGALLINRYCKEINSYLEDFLFLSFGFKGLTDEIKAIISKKEEDILDIDEFLKDSILKRDETKNHSLISWLKSKYTFTLAHLLKNKKKVFLILSLLIFLGAISYYFYKFNCNSFSSNICNENWLVDLKDSLILKITGLLALLSPLAKYFREKWTKFSPSAKKLWRSIVEISSEYSEDLEKWENSYKKEKQELVKKEEEIKSRILSLEREIASMKNVSGDSLSAFIQERTEDKTYKDRLGLLAKIRKDFERLSSLMTEYNSEELSSTKLNLNNLDSASHINRIVLYIDDLDRCPPERVVEVLQAVHLLLSFELFVVVVAVDSRWVIQCLRLGYKDLFIGDSIDLDGDGIIDISRATPHDYLEKIFQIPYWLNPIDEKGKKRLIASLISTKDRPEEEIDNDSKIESNDSPKPENLPEINEEDIKDSHYIRKQFLEKFPDSTRMELERKEIQFLMSLTPILGNSPRAIKRYVNVFKIIRVSLEDSKWNVYYYNSPSFEKKNIWNMENFKIVMFLQALITGSPSLSPLFFQELRDTDEKLKNLESLLTKIKQRVQSPENGGKLFQGQKVFYSEMLSESEDKEKIQNVYRKKILKEINNLEKWIKERRITHKEIWEEVYLNQIRFWDYSVSRYSFRIDPLR